MRFHLSAQPCKSEQPLAPVHSGDCPAGNSFTESTWGSPRHKTDHGPTVCPCGKKPHQEDPGLCEEQCCWQGTDVILPLPSSGDATPGCWSSSGLPRHKRCGHTGESLARSAEMMKGLEQCSFEESVRELGLFSLELQEGSGGSY